MIRSLTHRIAAVVFAVVGLSACVGPTSLNLADDHPASVKASEGLAESSTAFESYKSAADLAAVTEPPAFGMAGMHHDMSGMQHDMPGMQHQMAPGSGRAP